MDNLTEKIITIVFEEYGQEYEDSKAGSLVLNVSGIHEDYQRNLVMRLEEEFSVEIPDVDAEKLYTVKDIVDYLTKKNVK